MTAAKSQQSESCVVGDKKCLMRLQYKGQTQGNNVELQLYFATVLLNSLKSVIIGTWYIVYNNNCRHITVTRKRDGVQITSVCEAGWTISGFAPRDTEKWLCPFSVLTSVHNTNQGVNMRENTHVQVMFELFIRTTEAVCPL